MKSYWLLISSIFSALLASLCCLGAMSYMFFGIAVGFLNALDVPIWIRIIFAILSVGFLVLAFRAMFKKTCSKSPFKALGYTIVTIFVLGVILFPYIAGYLYE
ncbi:hypothetical protein [Campylobacter sp. 19-13652]|uniref:hypothetical protein n=1 Tax=Campylobacter sp. 19-13652 TaxID=2840180 RepID=UPI001C778C0D|nr:hypothetical protein [Campylobacter sp. 19-13652]BCX80027.1 hypothetical protein LBC_14890 [Campylobacter sp. 19-13652]